MRIGGVPLFSGFMYAAVGSYLARVWRIFDFDFAHFPSSRAMMVLAAAIYLNFFTHHWLFDLRWPLFAALFWMFRRTWVSFRPFRQRRSMPLLLGFFLVALFIWFAENIGTFAQAWTYPNQRGAWAPVGMAKLASWYLLMVISFALVALLHRRAAHGQSR